MRLRLAISSVLILIALGLGAYRGSILHEESRQLVIVIESGTAERLEAGTLETDLHYIELMLGVRDVLVIQNRDVVWHEVGPYRVAPGHTLVQRFYRPGTIQAACTITPSRQIAIVVRER